MLKKLAIKSHEFTKVSTGRKAIARLSARGFQTVLKMNLFDERTEKVSLGWLFIPPAH